MIARATARVAPTMLKQRIVVRLRKRYPQSMWHRIKAIAHHDLRCVGRLLERYAVCLAQVVRELYRTPIKLQVNRGWHRNQEMRTLKVPGGVTIGPAAKQER